METLYRRIYKVRILTLQTMYFFEFLHFKYFQTFIVVNYIKYFKNLPLLSSTILKIFLNNHILKWCNLVKWTLKSWLTYRCMLAQFRMRNRGRQQWRLEYESAMYHVPCTMCHVNCPCLTGPLRCVSAGSLQSCRVALNGAHFVRHCQLSSGIGSAQKAHGPLKASPASPTSPRYNPLP